MTSARDQILAGVRGALGRGELSAAKRGALERRLRHPKPNVIPARGQLAKDQQIQLFIDEAERISATTARLASWDLVPGAVAAYLKANNLPAEVTVAPDPLLKDIPWDRAPLLAARLGLQAAADIRVSVTGVFAAIAETGTLMLLSGPDSPTSLNFLPDTHIACVPTSRVVGAYEDGFAWLRAERGVGTMPRVVNMITGQSRTADIEQILLLGAHGPRWLHILLIDEPAV
ncbi:MAG: LUD domain-containing protein [Hyphomicrobiales bacterium]|nr:LUD domain-containing protein [Hyphomicrobiales bacterium]